MQRSVTRTVATVGIFLALLMAAMSNADENPTKGIEGSAVCDTTKASPLIQKKDCDDVAGYLEGLGQDGQSCSSNNYHDENGCTWMNTFGTCNANICDLRDLRSLQKAAVNCSTVAQSFRQAYNGCATDDDTLPAASYPLPGGCSSLPPTMVVSSKSLTIDDCDSRHIYTTPA